MSTKSLGERLLDLKERSGLSLANVARSGGYRNASSVQRYFDAAYDADFLPTKLAQRLKEALVGFGDPPITEMDVDVLTEYGFEFNRKIFRLPPAALQRRRTKFIECYPTFQTGNYFEEAEIFKTSEDAILAFEKSERLSDRPISSMYVSAKSLDPRFRLGEVIFYDQEKPPKLGDYVVVLFSENETDHGGAILAQLIDRERTHLRLHTLSPSATFDLPHNLVDGVYAILAASDLLPELGLQEAYALS